MYFKLHMAYTLDTAQQICIATRAMDFLLLFRAYTLKKIGNHDKTVSVRVRARLDYTFNLLIFCWTVYIWLDQTQLALLLLAGWLVVGLVWLVWKKSESSSSNKIGWKFLVLLAFEQPLSLYVNTACLHTPKPRNVHGCLSLVLCRLE